jgi:hypothetical protein
MYLGKRDSSSGDMITSCFIYLVLQANPIIQQITV